MPRASYHLRRAVWPLWKWEADYDGAAVRRGYALSKASARRAARSWLWTVRTPDGGSGAQREPADHRSR